MDDGSEDSSSCSGPAVREEEGKTEEDTDSEEDNGHHGPRHSDTEGEEGERAEEDGKGQGFTHNGEPEFKPKKVNFMVETFAHSSNHFQTCIIFINIATKPV